MVLSFKHVSCGDYIQILPYLGLVLMEATELMKLKISCSTEVGLRGRSLTTSGGVL